MPFNSGIRLQADEVISTPSSKRWPKVFSVLFRVALLVVAIVVLRRELAGVGPQEVFSGLRSYGLGNLALSLAFMVASFLALGGLELLALRYVGQRAERIIPRRTAMGTAFVAHAYSQSVGLAILTGAAVRVRSYARYGMDALDVARLSVFVTLTATLGLLTTGGVAFLATPGRITFAHLSISLVPAGALLLLPIVGYVAWAAFGRSEFHGRGRWRIRRPSLRLALEQIGISSVDWLLAGTVLFFLLPPSLHVSYSGLLGTYLVAQTAAVVSHVPGGLGVFEAIMIALLTFAGDGSAASPSTTAALAASLVVYRIVYYLLPLCGAIALSGVAEFIRSRNPIALKDIVPLRDPQPRVVPDAT